MQKKLILFVDNNRDFLDTRAEYLQQAGFQVMKAQSAEEARDCAERFHPDLAVLDVRLLKDDDENDFTGVFLTDIIRMFCPVIILTSFPTVDMVRQALKPDDTGRALAVDFLDKHDGPAVMVQAIRTILQSNRGFNGLSKRISINMKVVSVAAFIILSGIFMIFLFIDYDDQTTNTLMLVLTGIPILLTIGYWVFAKKH